MPLFYLDDSGIHIPTEQELIDWFGAQQIATVDSLLEIHPQSINGKQNSVFGTALMEVAELAIDIAEQLDPNKATGSMLASHGMLTGVRPGVATPSTAALTCNLDAGTTITTGDQVSVAGNADAVFAFDGPSFTAPANGDYDLAFTATAPGPTFAPAGTITVIETTLAGWNSATNALDAVVGTADETDEEFRDRRFRTLGAQGAATLDAILAELLGVSGVIDRKIFENIGDQADTDGVPPHSFEPVIYGGADADLADALWKSKGAGIQSYGATTVNVTDAQGWTQPVGFTRPTDRLLYVHAQITAPDGLDVAAAKQALVESTTLDTSVGYLGVGADVYGARLLCVLLDQEGAIHGKINVSFSPIGAFDPALHDQQLAVAPREIARADTVRITIEVL